LPRATIYVYDNNSQDNTAHKSLENGTVLTKELRQGKGNVVRNMFRNIDADIYILVDGDDTYPAEYVHELIKPILDREVDNEK
jgi:cellulose synthase/poly-beta-1,6-N-acetylglucosamine synthase-like glycosyltransferase